MKRLDIAQPSKEVRAFLETIKGEEEVYVREEQGSRSSALSRPGR